MTYVVVDSILSIYLTYIIAYCDSSTAFSEHIQAASHVFYYLSYNILSDVLAKDVVSETPSKERSNMEKIILNTISLYHLDGRAQLTHLTLNNNTVNLIFWLLRNDRQCTELQSYGVLLNYLCLCSIKMIIVNK